MDFAGRTAVVTGGGSGIGRGLALTWAAEGMNVVVADVRADPAEAVVEEIRATGQQAEAVQCDVSKPESVEALAEESFSRFKTVDLLCNNAGVGTFGSILDATIEDWHWILSVNLFGVVHGINAFVPRMRAQGGPAHIVNTGSAVTITAGNFGNGVYIASKAAVASLTERLRKELEPDRIGVSLLLASRVATSIHETSRQNRPAELGPVPEYRPDPVSNDAATLVPLDPLEVGRIVRDAVKANRAYIHTDYALRAGVLERNANVVEAFAFVEEARASSP
jgi:NAD(P)-dependent dehydrogenase (short-subunit alcohol dehydrogenase family)